MVVLVVLVVVVIVVVVVVVSSQLYNDKIVNISDNAARILTLLTIRHENSNHSIPYSIFSRHPHPFP